MYSPFAVIIYLSMKILGTQVQESRLLPFNKMSAIAKCLLSNSDMPQIIARFFQIEKR